MKKVLICDYSAALESSYDLTVKNIEKAYGEKVSVHIKAYVNDEELIKLLRGESTDSDGVPAEGLITGFLEIGEEIMSKVPALKCISVSGVGYANIDTKAAANYGITVCHIQEYCTEEVAEHTFSLIGALNRNIKYYTSKIEKEHEWKYYTISGGRNLNTQTLAVFGFGKIGKRVAAIAKAYGMKVVVVDPFVPRSVEAETGVEIVSPDKAFECADIVSNHMNLTSENYHFFNYEVFGKMKKKPIFINVARGGSVDEEALADALDEGLIRGAGLDVLEAEDPDLKESRLLGRNNVILTPHSAFYSEESIDKLQIISGANMGYYLAGKIDKIFSVVV
ncbi:MAG: NAD(P)-dependent oxidoreductase [Lachnospiraceae bacterium]